MHGQIRVDQGAWAPNSAWHAQPQSTLGGPQSAWHAPRHTLGAFHHYVHQPQTTAGQLRVRVGGVADFPDELITNAAPVDGSL